MAARAKPKVLATTRTEAEVSAQVVEAAQALGIELKRRNVGAFTNPAGRLVRCGEPGDSDWTADLPGGRSLHLEIKKESFDPTKVRGNEKARFDRQLAKLRKANECGAVGMWVRDSADFLHAMRRVLEGWKVEIDEQGYCWVTND